jgi:hypothetical protein
LPETLHLPDQVVELRAEVGVRAQDLVGLLLEAVVELADLVLRAGLLGERFGFFSTSAMCECRRLKSSPD